MPCLDVWTSSFEFDAGRILELCRELRSYDLEAEDEERRREVVALRSKEGLKCDPRGEEVQMESTSRALVPRTGVF